MKRLGYITQPWSRSLEEQKRAAQSFELDHRKTTTEIVDHMEMSLNCFLMN